MPAKLKKPRASTDKRKSSRSAIKTRPAPKESASVAETTSEADLLNCLQAALGMTFPDADKAEHELISFVEQHHSAITKIEEASSRLQWRAGTVLNVLYKKWHPHYSKQVKERLTLSERTALNYRDIATYCSKQEASTTPPTDLYEKVTKIKQELRAGLTLDLLKKKCQAILDSSYAFRQIVESGDRFALKCLYDEPSETIKAIDRCLPIITGGTGNVIAIGKALQKFRDELKALTK